LSKQQIVTPEINTTIEEFTQLLGKLPKNQLGLIIDFILFMDYLVDNFSNEEVKFFLEFIKKKVLPRIDSGS